MKKFLTISILLLAGLTVFAQDPVAMLREKLEKGRVTLDYRYDINGQVPFGGSGTVTIQGYCYHSVGDGLETWCNGSTKWTIDIDAKEVYVEAAEGAEEIENIVETYLAHITDVNGDAKGLTGTFVNPSDGTKVNIKLSNIKYGPVSGGKKDFTFNTTRLDDSWFITTL